MTFRDTRCADKGNLFGNTTITIMTMVTMVKDDLQLPTTMTTVSKRDLEEKWQQSKLTSFCTTKSAGHPGFSCISSALVESGTPRTLPLKHIVLTSPHQQIELPIYEESWETMCTHTISIGVWSTYLRGPSQPTHSHYLK